MARWGLIWDKKTLLKNLGLFAIMVISMRLTGGAGFAIMFLFAFAALSQDNHERLLLVLILTIGVVVGNHNLMPKGAAFNMEQKVLMLGLSIALTIKSFSMGRHSPLVRPFLLLMPYLLWMCVSSAQGWNPLISYLKLFLYSFCFFAIYGIANVVIKGERIPIIRVRTVFLSLCVFTLIGSVALIPFPGITQLSGQAYLDAIANGQSMTSLFTGIMYHSQALGPLCAALFVLLFSDMVLTVRKFDKLYLVLLICAPILIYKTSSRTAMGSMMAGCIFTLWLFTKTRQVSSVWKTRVMSAVMFCGLAGAVLIAVSSSGREAFLQYVLKTNSSQVSSADVSSESVLSTRQGLIDIALYHFRQKPMIGNGFQVSEEMARAGAGGKASLLSAPVEKGVWVTAVLEEGGIPGLILILIFLVGAETMLINRKGYIGATMLVTMFVANLGEFSMFSMSGDGGYYWALCFIGVVLDAQRLREEKIVYWYATPEEIAFDPALDPYA